MSGMKVAADASARPPARFHGSKHTLGPWIMGHLPADHDTYDEPYCGMANVLLLKERSLIEAINDRSGDVVNFFRVLREAADELIQAIDLTPFAWDEWKLSCEPTEDPLEQARRFYARAYMSIAGPTSSSANPGFRRQKKFSRGKDGRKTMMAAAKTFADVDHLWGIAERLKGVTIENEDALVHISRYDHPRTLFYVDPPYMPDTRVRDARLAYEHEMDEGDHAALLDALNGLSGLVVLSGYRCPLYDNTLEGWARFDKTARVNGEGSKVESLWLNPAAEHALQEQTRREAHADMPLFARKEER